ncbi:MAG TPA: sialidase family protein, partial [Limnochordia bacterium]|nr:sialidase family protein [Limnochordia bacterium]
GPDGSLLAVWTQSARASGLPGGRQVNRIVMARSDDEGASWTAPKAIVGDAERMASWAFPLVSRTGRIYVVYNRNLGSAGWIKMHTGVMEGIYSDDLGASWSEPQRIPLPTSPYDDPAGEIPPEWIVWQMPMRDQSGGFLVGYTHWLHPARARYDKVESWTQIESVCEFMRFENVDERPEPRDLAIRYAAWGEQALRAPYFKDPLLSVAQEPSLVRLPDGRLFCVMRTNSGMIWYSLSADDGRNWCNPRPLLRRDHGEPILQPVSCCPIYPLADGRYVLLHHNQRGDIHAQPERTHQPRRPAYLALAEFRPDADQPLWFSRSKVFVDNDGIGVDGRSQAEHPRIQTGIGLYTSFTSRGGRDVLWYPDRKFFLLGKRITAEFLSDLEVPAG